jgi:hypothetical protein
MIRFSYEGLDEIMRLINRNKLQIIGQNYDRDACIIIQLKESDIERITKLFKTSQFVINIENSPG